MYKSLVVIVDDFSDRVFDIDHNNVYMYDYGTRDIIKLYDFVYTDIYDNIDDPYYVVQDVTPGFDRIFEPSIAEFTSDLGQFVKIGSETLNDLYGNPYFSDTFIRTTRFDTATKSQISHGDWTLFSFLEQLDTPNLTDVICIDVDTLPNSGAVNPTHLNALWTNSTSDIGQGTHPAIMNCVFEFLNFKDTRFTGDSSDHQYHLTVMSASLGGTPTTIEESSFDYFSQMGTAIVQSAPNVGQGDYDWGSNYPNVINVGAYNVDKHGQPLLSSLNTVGTIDLIADGLVSNWGTSTFGTSFSTPRVSAEITNAWNYYLTQFNNGTITVPDGNNNNSDFNYDLFVDQIVDVISTPIHVNFIDYENNGYYFNTNLMTDDVSDPLQPTVVDFISSGLPYIITNISTKEHSPVILSSYNTTVDSGEEYYYIISASDDDIGDSVTYKALEIPNWLQFDETTGQLIGTPTMIILDRTLSS